MKTLLLSLVILAPALARAEPMPGVRCETVKKMAIHDLPGFCANPKVDSRRLVDYGFQLDALEACGEKPLSDKIARALFEKAQRGDAVACADISQEIREEK